MLGNVSGLGWGLLVGYLLGNVCWICDGLVCVGCV